MLVILTLYVFGDYIGGLESFDFYTDDINKPSPNDDCKNEEILAIRRKDQNFYESPLAKECKDFWGGQAKLKVFTYVLCTFSFLQIFNYINCRKIGQSELNVFEKIFSRVNWYFWAVIAFVAFFQIVMVQFFSILTRTTPLSRSEWGACIIAGATVLPISLLLKLTGTTVLKKIPFTKFINENEKGDDRLVSNIQKYSNVEVNIPSSDTFKRKSKTN